MQNRCCAIGWFLINSSKAHAHLLATLMILRNFISLRAFTVYMQNSLRFELSLRYRSEICTEVSFTTPDVMRTLIMKLPDTKMKLYPEVNSQTGLSSLRVACKRARSVYCVWTSVTVFKYVRDTSLGQFVQK